MKADAELARRQASEDMVDIAELRNTQAFQRYWMRQLRTKRETFLASMLNDPPSVVDKEEREVLRRLIRFCDELERMPQAHAAAAEQLLRNPT